MAAAEEAGGDQRHPQEEEQGADDGDAHRDPDGIGAHRIFRAALESRKN